MVPGLEGLGLDPTLPSCLRIPILEPPSCPLYGGHTLGFYPMTRPSIKRREQCLAATSLLRAGQGQTGTGYSVQGTHICANTPLHIPCHSVNSPRDPLLLAVPCLISQAMKLSLMFSHLLCAPRYQLRRALRKAALVALPLCLGMCVPSRPSLLLILVDFSSPGGMLRSQLWLLSKQV